MTTLESEKIVPEIIEEAKELSRGAEILPDGYMGLARKIHQVRKAGRVLRVKLGIDPTSTDLHIGHAVPFRKLSQFQKYGHQIVLIIGGFTAQIGDPSGRNATRPHLTAEDVEANAKTYLDQMGLVLDLEKTEVRNNAEWLAPLNLNDILKLAGKVTVNQLLAKEAFGSRLEQQLPVSLHELFYPLLQGYDSVAIKADVELGGTDQRFNILQGRELQPHYMQDQQVALLLPLLEGTDGIKKMSKTYDNYIALKDEPGDMFGKCMRIPDHLIVKYYELATNLSGAAIDRIKKELDSGINPKEIKLDLAKQIVAQYHGEQTAAITHEEWIRVHSEKQLPEDMPEQEVENGLALFRVLAATGLASGSGVAKRKVADGGVRIDGEQITDPNFTVNIEAGASVVLQVGRRNFVRVRSKT
ncbi:MAG: tyrosine--tRNA ligase [Candidatus Melainabacteria bacterium]|nr:tyrosine--tRNA ligase [Candidatus Melainabacteria bacterium]